MQVYVRLAQISTKKKQPQVRDRFLLLGGAAACRAGWPEVAACCQQQLRASNPALQLHRFPTFADALRNSEFQQLLAHWERYCPFETAEAMLRQLNLPPLPETSLSLGEQLVAMLTDAVTNEDDARSETASDQPI